MVRTRKSGFGINPPENSCKDKKCPFHGTIKVRGKQFRGRIISDKMQNSVIVEWAGWRYVPKYERYKKTRTRVVAHNPPCINVSQGDLVLIGECRQLSKTKNFVILQVLGKQKKYTMEKEALDEGKYKTKQKEQVETQKEKAAEEENQ